MIARSIVSDQQGRLQVGSEDIEVMRRAVPSVVRRQDFRHKPSASPTGGRKQDRKLALAN
jgi:hypothetical protein